MNLLEEALQVTLKAVEGTPDVWLDPTKGPNTRLVHESGRLSRPIELENDETPILEFDNGQRYSLVTIRRVVSIYDNTIDEMKMENIQKVKPVFADDHLENPKPWRVLSATDLNDNCLLMEFDPGIPTYFALMLILNISYQKQFGRWHTNPSRKFE